jgi:hypothetical protein
MVWFLTSYGVALGQVITELQHLLQLLNKC